MYRIHSNELCIKLERLETISIFLTASILYVLQLSPHPQTTTQHNII